MTCMLTPTIALSFTVSRQSSPPHKVNQGVTVYAYPYIANAVLVAVYLLPDVNLLHLPMGSYRG